ncbi:hypothetical protein JCM10908_006532 [Rhodotorula pacifica]|uniref:uncharacterized protein n=1 Tax=Rhodotorula pacifica TaxID=1495444 RepID=UPI00317A2AA3
MTWRPAGQPFSVPIQYGSGSEYRYIPPAPVNPHNFHGHGGGSNYSYSSSSNNPAYRPPRPANSQSSAGGGFPPQQRRDEVFALNDDFHLGPEQMFRPDAGFRDQRRVSSAERAKERCREKHQRQRSESVDRFGGTEPKPESPRKKQKREEKERKEMLERRSRVEADEEAEAKRREARDRTALLKKARSLSGSFSDTPKPAFGDVVDKEQLKQIASTRRTNPAASTDGSANPSVLTKKVRVDKGDKPNPFQGDASGESGGVGKGKASRHDDSVSTKTKDKGKCKDREKKASRLGATRRAGFEDDDDDAENTPPSQLRAADEAFKAAKERRASPRKKHRSPIEEPTPVKAVPFLTMFNEEQGPASDGNVTLSDSSDDDEVIERLREGRGRADTRFDSPYPEFDPTQAPVNPDTLCPFCDQPLPDNPSDDLLRKRDALINDPSARRKKTMKNSKAVRLREGHVVRTAEFCKQHRDERIFIPEGRARGWPTEIDWEALPARIEKLLSTHLSIIVLGNFETPLLDKARSDFARVGGKRGNAVNDLATFGVEEPGYYGPKGRKVICDAVTQLMTVTVPLLSTSHRIEPLDVDFYIRRVLLPECAIELVRDDLGGPSKVTREHAEQVVQESRGYGKAVFPDVGEGDERAATEAPEDNADDDSSSGIEIESTSRRASTSKKDGPRAPPSSSQSPRKSGSRKPKKGQTLHISSGEDEDLDGDASDETATASKRKLPAASATTKAGGLRMPKNFVSSGDAAKPPSSGSSATAATSRTSKASNSTGLTVPDSEASDDDASLRPPPSAQPSSSKAFAFAVKSPVSTSGLFAGMPSSSPADVSDSDPSSDSDAALNVVVNTGLQKRGSTRERVRKLAGAGNKKGESPKKAGRRKESKSPKKKKKRA